MRLAISVATLVLGMLGSLPASAQDAGFPPWPIIYDGTVEVDYVEPFEAGFREGTALIGRIGVEDGRGVHVAPEEPHADAVLDVDRGIENHGVASREVSGRSPISRLA